MDWIGSGQGDSADHNATALYIGFNELLGHNASIRTEINAIHNNETDRRIAGIGNTSNSICLL